MRLDAPLKFAPALQRRLWGGDRLCRLLGKGDGRHGDVGEAWELSDQLAGPSVVAEGPGRGESLRTLMGTHREDLLGTCPAAADGSFPLLYKFIDAKDDLSVQVHPGAGSPLGDAKTEAWYVVDAPPGAGLIAGLAAAGERGALLEQLQGPRARAALNSIPVAPGDVVFIPAGTVHALTAGLLIYEVQQNSDTTFRLYDWDRRDEQGRPRQLHLSQAAQVLDTTVHDRHKMIPLALEAGACRREFLTACPFFALLRLSRFRGALPLGGDGRFHVLTGLAGGARLHHTGGAMEIAPGDTVLLPAAARASLESLSKETAIIYSFVPDLGVDVISPLEEAGHSREAIDRLGGNRGLYGDARAK